MSRGYLKAPVLSGVNAAPLLPHLRGGATELRVMTYNVNWRAFHGPQAVKSVYVMARFIAGYMPDVLCLQEIRHDCEFIKLLAALTKLLPNFRELYAAVPVVAGEAGMMTLIKQRLFDMDRTHVVSGDFLTPSDRVPSGRPYLILRLHHPDMPERVLVVANVHFPHTYELGAGRTLSSVYAQLEAALQTAVTGGAGEQDEEEEPMIVIAGDFNHNAHDEWAEHMQSDMPTLMSMHHGPEPFPTYFSRDTRQFDTSLDFILNNWQHDGDRYEYRTMDPFERQLLTASGEPLMSDHLPVMAAIPYAQVWPTPPHTLPPITIPNKCLFLAHVTNDDPSQWTELRLHRKKETGKIDDGAYCLLITTDNYDSTVVFSAARFDPSLPWYLILLPVSTLAQGNYHVNVVDQQGHMSPVTTFMPWELETLVDVIAQERAYATTLPPHDDLASRPFAEVVFSRPVPFIPGCFKILTIPPPHARFRLLSSIVPRDKFEPATACTFFPPGAPHQPAFRVSEKSFYERDYFYQTFAGLSRSEQNLYIRTLLAVMEEDLEDETLYSNGEFHLEEVSQRLYRKMKSALRGTFEPRLYEWLEWVDFQKSRQYKLVTANLHRYVPRFHAWLQQQRRAPPGNTESEVFAYDVHALLQTIDRQRQKRQREEGGVEPGKEARR